MKKKLLISLISIALLSGVSVAYRIYSEINRNSLLLENIEALADSESASIYCYNSIKIVDTPEAGQFVTYCGTCETYPGKPTILSGTGYCTKK